MLQDKVEYVSDIFGRHVPYLDYSLLGSRSVRNSLLAHYLLENLAANCITAFLERDANKQCIPKLALADEVYHFTRRDIIYLRSDVVPSSRIGRCYPKTKLDKFAMICGFKLYRAIYGKRGNITSTEMGAQQDERPPEERKSKKDISALLNNPTFKDISEGADPTHAAWCYLHLFGDYTDELIEYEAGIDRSETVADLRRLLGFKIYQDRIVLPDLKEENFKELANPENPMELVFLQAVVNWHKDLLLRLDKTT